MSATKQITCFGRVVGRNFVQEWYETKSRDGAARAAHLRQLGFSALVSAMGNQVTPVGLVKMSLVTIRGENSHESPEPYMARRVR